MGVSQRNTRLWVGVPILVVGALLIAWISTIYAVPGSAQSYLLTFDFFWAVLIAVTGAVLVISGLARKITRTKGSPGDPRAEVATPLVDPGLTYIYQRKPPPPT